MCSDENSGHIETRQNLSRLPRQEDNDPEEINLPAQKVISRQQVIFIPISIHPSTTLNNFPLFLRAIRFF